MALHGLSEIRSRIVNIVITGITSLIGNNIADYFIKKGHNVTTIGRRKNFSLLKKDLKFENIDWQNIDNFFKKAQNIDIFIHCAGIDSHESLINEKKAYQFNSETTGRLAKLCSKSKVKLFVYLSTIHVYSKNPFGLLLEDLEPVNDHPYAKSKLLGEKLLKTNISDSNMKYLILRLSNVIATPLFIQTNCWKLVAQNICRQIFEKKEIYLVSDPNLERDFIGVNELNKFLNYYFDNLLLMESDTFNFASGCTRTILELANRVKIEYDLLYDEDIKIKYNNFKINKSGKNTYIYSVKKIESIGFKINKSFNIEIRELLKFCSLNFKS